MARIVKTFGPSLVTVCYENLSSEATYASDSDTGRPFCNLACILTFSCFSFASVSARWDSRISSTETSLRGEDFSLSWS